MNKTSPQTLANHGRIDPLFHFVISPTLLICFGFAVSFAVHQPDRLHLWLVVFSFAAFLLAFKCRIYALKVQDRIIRLEERLRLSALLPEPLKARVSELSERQLIALRFASDDETPALVDKTLRENLDPKAIKQAIHLWRPDYWRV